MTKNSKLKDKPTSRIKKVVDICVMTRKIFKRNPLYTQSLINTHLKWKSSHTYHYQDEDFLHSPVG